MRSDRLPEIAVGIACWTSAVLVVMAMQGASARAADDYVGVAACVDCHPQQHASFLETTHSQSLRPTVPGDEPAGASVDHSRSHRKFVVEKVDDQLVHRQQWVDKNGKQITENAFPMSITVGSGQHAKSFLYRDGNFVGQSPLTWYNANDPGKPAAWDMSPGYDVAQHSGFRRSVTSDCLFCHVGQLERESRSTHRYHITEHAISCERCHGPGANHVAIHGANHQGKKTDDKSPGLVDSIVNPSKLERKRSEAICEQCHLQAAIAMGPSGSSVWDFRPGELLTKYRTDFQYQMANRPMKIVGHVEQMHASECYVQSETMTCITCHDPHGAPTPEARVQVFRDACLACHEDKQCGVEHQVRTDRNSNDCGGCHMPATQTNVAHVAFRNHKVAVYREGEQEVPFSATQANQEASDLTPVVDHGDVPKSEMERRKAIAMYRLFERKDDAVDLLAFRQKSTATIFAAAVKGKSDSDGLATLAVDALQMGEAAIAETMAKDAIKLSEQGAMTSAVIAAHRVLGQISFGRREERESLNHFEIVNRYVRNTSDLHYLGMCQANVGQTEDAIKTFRTAIKIDPAMASAHQALAAIYTSQNKLDDAKVHQDIVAKLDQAQR